MRLNIEYMRLTTFKNKNNVESIYIKFDKIIIDTWTSVYVLKSEVILK